MSERQPTIGVGFLARMRKLERKAQTKPRIGKNVSLKEEVLRLGQDPFLAFPETDFSHIGTDKDGKPELRNQLIGFFGPHGALPLNTTEEVARWVNAGDQAFVRFTDIFATRFQALFFRAWSDARAITQFDHNDGDRFSRYIGAIIGKGTPAWQKRTKAVDDTKSLAMASLAMGRVKSPMRLQQMLRYDLASDVHVEEHVPTWISFESDSLNRLGLRGSTLGRDCIVGSRVQSVNEKIAIHIRTKSLAEYRTYLPGGSAYLRLRDIVIEYLNQSFEVDVKLSLPANQMAPAVIGKSAELGWMASLTPNDAANDPELAKKYLPAASYQLTDAA
ncbi:type VI secretion system protein ImpH [Cognatiyoonia koreensis]|uniref:Type VI secretion system protein ImpH n=1 Tax=Cognatiyoonia koreensis TaxID=364200 RepID=A0A1I0RGI9_9RHOB|nr:type VI secretion system baseplate subunit TssG [Cognatiyoonia koreensis]SEW40023.1 type VI secretion system protein ImpH [Cognatiyoonia koreensis]